MTGQLNLWKLDENLNTLIQYDATGSAPYFVGLYFNPNNRFLYFAPYAFSVIYVFNLKNRLLKMMGKIILKKICKLKKIEQIKMK